VGSVDRLDAVRVVSPCTVSWDGMVGDERVRHCGQCRKNVYNVEAMTREEAITLIESAEGRVCMRLAYRADGTVVTGNCRARLRAARDRGTLAFLAMLFVMFVAELWTQAFGLRMLSAWFDREEAIPSVRVDDVQKGPLVKIRRPAPSKDVERRAMGDVPLQGL
jgi:hypothetical protein